jgi:flagellar basal body-associated protein FliL
MRNKGLVILWLLALVQHSAAVTSKQKKHQQKQQQQQQQQQQQLQPYEAFLGLLAVNTAPAVAAYKSVNEYNHSLPIPLLKNGGWARVDGSS